MKLIKRTYLESFLWLLPVLLIGSVFSFYMIKYIIYEETDEFLVYEMERLTEYHLRYNDLPEFHKVADIIADLNLDAPVFKDTLILEPRDNEMIPHRELWFTLNHEGKNFTIVLRHLLPGNDDIIEGTILMMIGLLFLVSLFLFLMVQVISRRIWKPFYSTLNTLKGYKITQPLPLLFDSGIEEFNSLNATVGGLLKKISGDYLRTKEFNENASHELQTHLSVIRLNAEKLLNNSLQDYSDPEYLEQIIHATTKLSQVQKSLLLLSRIGNLEYSNNTRISFEKTVSQSLELFSEPINMRNIKTTTKLEECIVNMDAGLAEILVNNLLKNAVKHNREDGHISINLTPSLFEIENTGLPYSGNPQNLFERFAKGAKGNLGLGLAIVKQICEVYSFGISYSIEGDLHKIKVSFIRD